MGYRSTIRGVCTTAALKIFGYDVLMGIKGRLEPYERLKFLSVGTPGECSHCVEQELEQRCKLVHTDPEIHFDFGAKAVS